MVDEQINTRINVRNKYGFQSEKVKLLYIFYCFRGRVHRKQYLNNFRVLE